MEQQPVTQLQLTDHLTGSDIYAMLRIEGAAVNLVLSSRDDGDIAVTLDGAACVRLADALREAADKTRLR